MGFARIKGSLTSRIGQKVRFGAPKDVKRAGGGAHFGVIVDEIWADETINTSPPKPSKGKDDWGDYSFFAQRIKRDKGGKIDYLIRLGYYRRRAGEDFWEFAGQYTLCANSRKIKAMLDGMAAKPDWFQGE